MFRLLLVLSLAFLALGFFPFEKLQIHVPWYKLKAFDSFFGFTGALILVLLSEGLGKHLLFRRQKEDES